jgi:hypothetical protein
MTTTNPPVLPIYNIDINRNEPPDLIEVPPEILSKIENVEESNNNNCPTILKKCWKCMKNDHNVYHGTNIYGVSSEHYSVLQLLLFFIIHYSNRKCQLYSIIIKSNLYLI